MAVLRLPVCHVGRDILNCFCVSLAYVKTEVPLGPPAAVGSSPTVGSAATVKPARPQDTSVFGVFTTELPEL